MMKISAVALDSTANYSFQEEDKRYISGIKDVYFFNSEQRTHLCEFTPSYFLEYLYTFIIWNEDCFDEISDRLVDEIKDRITTRYCYEPTDDTYVHCSSINSNSTVKDCGEFESEEEARECLQGNCPI